MLMFDVGQFLKIYTLPYTDDTVVFPESAEELRLSHNTVHDCCTTIGV